MARPRHSASSVHTRWSASATGPVILSRVAGVDRLREAACRRRLGLPTGSLQVQIPSIQGIEVPVYRREKSGRFGKPRPAQARSKPLKRPMQSRARATVQAIYDTFVRIWRRGGWEAITTRALALEAGISVGALYEYFPSKHAVLSGYVRHCIEQRIGRVDRESVAPPELDWRNRVMRLIVALCGDDAVPYYDAGMLRLEAHYAEPKHHARFVAELAAAWQRTLAACTDLPGIASPAFVDTLVVAVWGGYRYRLLLDPPRGDNAQWISEITQVCIAALERLPAADAGA